MTSGTNPRPQRTQAFGAVIPASVEVAAKLRILSAMDETERAAIHRLRPELFPMTIEVIRTDNKQFVWGATVLAPRDGLLHPLYIPPCATWIGGPVYVRTTYGTGESHIIGMPDD